MRCIAFNTPWHAGMLGDTVVCTAKMYLHVVLSSHHVQAPVGIGAPFSSRAWASAHGDGCMCLALTSLLPVRGTPMPLDQTHCLASCRLPYNQTYRLSLPKFPFHCTCIPQTLTPRTHFANLSTPKLSYPNTPSPDAPGVPTGLRFNSGGTPVRHHDGVAVADGPDDLHLAGCAHLLLHPLQLLWGNFLVKCDHVGEWRGHQYIMYVKG